MLAGLPRVTIEADRRALAPEVMRALGAVRVQQRLSVPTLCELRFFDPPGPLDVETALEIGARFRLTLDGLPTPLFDGQVTAVEYVYEPSHGREIRVRGYDALHTLRKRQALRAHVQVNLNDLAQELVAGLGITVQAAETGPFWPYLIQHRQSDLDLLVELADRCGLYLTLRDETLHLITLEGTGDSVALTLGQSLFEARIDVNGDPACRSVAASGWNPARGEMFQGKASAARVGRSTEAAAAPDRFGVDGHRALAGALSPDADHVQGLAQAELDRRQAREVTLRGVAEGDPRLRPGTPVEIAGVAERVSGRYVLTGTTHLIDRRQGYVTEFSTEPPSLREPQRGAVAAPGRVTQIDDPDGLGRVRVRLPTFEDVETDWLSVLTAAAGGGKGLIALPEIGDLVLVLLAHDDPGQGVVLGGLYGSLAPPDTGIEGGARRRFSFLTPGGQRVSLDDAENLLRLENSAGSFMELRPDRVRLHAAADLEIEAPGKSIVIRGQAIDFTQG
jgi:uncharacterized protein involved in type VI secretion and phage assembly